MGSKKPSSQTSTSENKPWAPSIPILENILNQADKLFNEQGGINAEWIDKEIADLTPEMQETVKNMISNPQFTDLAQQYKDIAAGGQAQVGQAGGALGGLLQQGIKGQDINELASELYDSELVKSQTAQLGADVQDALGKDVQALNQRAASSGGMGSSRAGVAQGVATGKAADAMATGSAAIQNQARQSAYQQAGQTLMGNQSTALGAAGQLGSLGMGQLGMLNNVGNLYQQNLQNQLTGSGILQQYQQGVLNNKWMNQMGQQQMGWDQLNKLLGVAGSIGGMGGTNTTTQTGGGGKGGGMAGLGSLVGGVGSLVGAFSDARLKDDVFTLREAEEGEYDGVKLSLPRICMWKWNDLAKQLFEEHGVTNPNEYPTPIGVIAQELEEVAPELVVYSSTDVAGLDGKVRGVNYLMLTEYARILTGEKE